MDRRELLEILRVGLEKMKRAAEAEAAEDPSIFNVRPVSNGFLVDYNDLEKYEVTTYAYPAPPTPGRMNTPEEPRQEKALRFRFKRVEVYCADAAAIKTAVDEALRLEEKVKLAIAEGILSGDTDSLVVGAR